MLLFTVLGRTVRVALTSGAVPVSRTVSVTVVSALTGLGAMMRLPLVIPDTGTMAWLLEATM